MQLTIRAAKAGPTRWITFQDGADTSKFADVMDWVFEFKEPGTSSLIDVNSKITDFGIRRNPQTGGYVNPEALPLAYAQSYAVQHITAVSGPEVSLTGPLKREDLDKVPWQILNAFVSRTDPTAVVTTAEVASLKRTPSSEDQPLETAQE